MINHILVPLDGSDQSEHALRYALSLAEAYDDCRVTLLAVMLRFPESKIHVPRLDDQSEARGEDYLKEVVARTQRSVPLATKVRLGVPADQITKAAREEGVDLIVMSTHGTAGSDRNPHSLGSTAWGVLQDAPCPIFLVPQGGV